MSTKGSMKYVNLVYLRHLISPPPIVPSYPGAKRHTLCPDEIQSAHGPVPGERPDRSFQVPDKVRLYPVNVVTQAPPTGQGGETSINPSSAGLLDELTLV